MGDLFAEEQDAAFIGAQQAVGELEQDALAYASRAEQDASLSGRDGEADVLQHRRAIEGDGDVAKDHHRAGIRGRLLTVRAGDGLVERRRVAHRGGMMVSSTWVRRKSTRMMNTEDHTTA